MSPRALALAGAILALAAAPAPALAGTASISGSQLSVAASPGQSNTLTVTVDATNFRVAETGSGATLTVGAGCSTGGTNQVLCPMTGLTSMSILGDDNNDWLTNSTSLPATLDGGTGNDVLSGGTGADTMIGGIGSDYVSYSARTNPVTADLDGVADDGQTGENDQIAADVETLVGGSGADTLTGNGSDNGLDGGPGADHLNGGGGNDYVLYWTRTNPVSVTFDGVADEGELGENDVVAPDVKNAVGGLGNDTMVGDSGANTFWGWDGNDTLDGGGGADELHGLNGVDTVTYASRTAPVTVTADGVAGDGETGENDNVGTTVENVTGGSAGDTITGNASANTLDGGPGADVLDGGLGADVLTGGGGTDRVTYATRAAPVTADIDGVADDGEASENDNIQTDVENITGGTVGDNLTGSAAANTLDGGPGADALDGADGNDVLDGGQNADTLVGGNGTDLVTYASRTNPVVASADGVAGDGETGENDNIQTDVENITGGTVDDVLTGSSAANTLDGGPGNDTLDGGLGNDTLDGGLGADTLIGAGGTDLATYASRTVAVTADIDGVADDGQPGESDNLDATVESITGGTGADVLTGSSAANTLDGGPGNDTLDGGLGADTLIGAGGTDLATYAGRTVPVNVDLNGSADDGEAGENDNVGADVENITGGAAGDALSGGAGANSLSGGGGADVLTGASGNDALHGDSGADSLRGAAGDDLLDGGADNDTLDGGTGADELAGGTGTDRAEYAGRTAAVTVDLNHAADDGADGERDNVRGDVENVTGGSGDDTLRGDEHANLLEGGAGDDTLYGGGGTDVLSGAAGADTIDSRDDAADRVSCGTESDVVSADAADLIAGDCEDINPGTPHAASKQKVKISKKPVTLTADGRAPIKVSCPSDRAAPCRGTIVLELVTGGRAKASRRSRRRRVGKASFKVAPGRSKVVKVRLSRHGRRRVLRKRRARCRVTVTTRGANGKKSVITQVLTLKAPKPKQARR